MKKDESFLTNTTKLFVLSTLGHKETHGYDMITKFKKKTGKNLSAGQIYPLLSKMMKEGYVSKKSIMDGLRQRNIYSLTSKGIQLKEDTIRQFKLIME